MPSEQLKTNSKARKDRLVSTDLINNVFWARDFVRNALFKNKRLAKKNVMSLLKKWRHELGVLRKNNYYERSPNHIIRAELVIAFTKNLHEGYMRKNESYANEGNPQPPIEITWGNLVRRPRRSN